MAIPARQDVSLEQRHRREILEYQRRVDQESLRRASVMAAANESERGMANDDEPEGPSPDDAQERRTKPTLWGYKFVFVLAICKDLIDLSIVATIPGIGFIITSMFWIAMFIAMYLAKTNRSLFEIKKIATLAVGYILEAFGFLLATLPMQTIVAVVIFLIDKAESNDKIMKAIQLVENIADIKHKK